MATCVTEQIALEHAAPVVTRTVDDADERLPAWSRARTWYA